MHNNQNAIISKKTYTTNHNDNSDIDEDEVVEIDSARNVCNNSMTMKDKLNEAIAKQVMYCIAGKNAYS